LLKVLSQIWDSDRAAGKPLPRQILDCGCGCGVIGVCAAALALPSAPELRVRAQDRDELARVFTGYNARINGIAPQVLEAHTEALLTGPGESSWDLILSNIPAKAGEPVLEDFVPRSLGLLEREGKVLLVAVHTLGDFFRSRINRAGGEIFREEAGPGHIVFVYSRGESKAAKPIQGGDGFLESNPFYLRRRLDYEFEGITLGMDTIHGAPGFDRPGGAVEAAAKLVRRLGLTARIVPGCPVLFHEPGQGWFPAWFRALGEMEGSGENCGAPVSPWVLSGRNILALEAARRNVRAAGKGGAGAAPLVVPAVDLSFYRDKLREAPGLPGAGESAGAFGFIAAFPEPVPRFDGSASCWEGFAALLKPGGVALAGLSSLEAERLDRKKPPRFTRLGDLRRNGFRALAYQKS
jgi:hypothetical protein